MRQQTGSIHFSTLQFQSRGVEKTTCSIVVLQTSKELLPITVVFLIQRVCRSNKMKDSNTHFHNLVITRKSTFPSVMKNSISYISIYNDSNLMGTQSSLPLKPIRALKGLSIYCNNTPRGWVYWKKTPPEAICTPRPERLALFGAPFTGLDSVVVPQNWQISGMTRADNDLARDR